MVETREDNVYRAKLAEQAERYDGLFRYIFNQLSLLSLKTLFDFI